MYSICKSYTFPSQLEIFSVPILKHQFDHLKKYIINYEATFTCHSRNSQSRTYGYINIFSLGVMRKRNKNAIGNIYRNERGGRRGGGGFQGPKG